MYHTISTKYTNITQYIITCSILTSQTYHTKLSMRYTEIWYNEIRYNEIWYISVPRTTNDTNLHYFQAQVSLKPCSHSSHTQNIASNTIPADSPSVEKQRSATAWACQCTVVVTTQLCLDPKSYQKTISPMVSPVAIHSRLGWQETDVNLSLLFLYLQQQEPSPVQHSISLSPNTHLNRCIPSMSYTRSLLPE